MLNLSIFFKLIALGILNTQSIKLTQRKNSLLNKTSSHIERQRKVNILGAGLGLASRVDLTRAC